jgi:1,4-dihydroxy-6-naphthoate synthase
MKITIAHSPDSDDAFMFYGLAKGGVPTGDLEVSHVLTDIETLNRHAQEGRYEVAAVSFHAYPHVADRYALMPCGGSIGDGYGPLLVAREPMDPKVVAGKTVAVPGTLTSAYPRCSSLRPASPRASCRSTSSSTRCARAGRRSGSSSTRASSRTAGRASCR